MVLIYRGGLYREVKMVPITEVVSIGRSKWFRGGLYREVKMVPITEVVSIGRSKWFLLQRWSL